MKPFFLLPLVLAMVSCGTSSTRPQETAINRPSIDFILSQPRRPPPLGTRISSFLFPTETQRSFQLERMADLQVWYTTSGRIRIDSVSGKADDREGSPDELNGFIQRQQKKSLVVVVIAKNTWDEAQMAPHIAFLNDYFSRCGYRRVVVQQARGFGQPTLSDTSPGSSRSPHYRPWRR